MMSPNFVTCFKISEHAELRRSESELNNEAFFLDAPKDRDCTA